MRNFARFVGRVVGLVYLNRWNLLVFGIVVAAFEYIINPSKSVSAVIVSGLVLYVPIYIIFLVIFSPPGRQTSTVAAPPNSSNVVHIAVRSNRPYISAIQLTPSTTSVGRFMDQDIPRYVELTDGELWVFDGVILKNHDNKYDISNMVGEFIVIDPGLIYRKISLTTV